MSASVSVLMYLLWTYEGLQPLYSAALGPGHILSHRPSADESPAVWPAEGLGGVAAQLVERRGGDVPAAMLTSTLVVEAAAG